MQRPRTDNLAEYHELRATLISVRETLHACIDAVESKIQQLELVQESIIFDKEHPYAQERR